MASQAASATHTELVAAPFSVVWRLLEEKARLVSDSQNRSASQLTHRGRQVYHPERSVPGISNVCIVSDKGGVEGVERRMFQATKGADIHELITWETSPDKASGVLRFNMLSDPCLEGVVLNEAVAEGGATRVTYTLDWRFRDGVSEEQRKAPFPDAGAGAISAAVRALKATAEKAASAS